MSCQCATFFDNDKSTYGLKHKETYTTQYLWMDQIGRLNYFYTNKFSVRILSLILFYFTLDEWVTNDADTDIKW